jgi:hypothetical protein
MDRQASQSTKQQQKLDVKIYGQVQAPAITPQQKKVSLQPTTPAQHSKGAKHSVVAPQQQLKPPIIIVPESESALVSLYNAKELLQVSCRFPVCFLFHLLIHRAAKRACKCNSQWG